MLSENPVPPSFVCKCTKTGQSEIWKWHHRDFDLWCQGQKVAFYILYICVVCTILILFEEYMLQYIRCQNTWFQLFQKAHNRTVLEPEDYWLCHGTMRFQNTKMYVNQHEIDANICNTSINFLFHVSDLCSCEPLVLHTVVANTT